MPMPNAGRRLHTEDTAKVLEPEEAQLEKGSHRPLGAAGKADEEVDAARIAMPALPPDRKSSPTIPSVESRLKGAATFAESKRSRHQPPASVPTAMATDISATMPTAEFISTPRESM